MAPCNMVCYTSPRIHELWPLTLSTCDLVRVALMLCTRWQCSRMQHGCITETHMLNATQVLLMAQYVTCVMARHNVTAYPSVLCRTRIARAVAQVSSYEHTTATKRA
eukprot:8022-Heterococcus_DN1.PRE.4